LSVNGNELGSGGAFNATDSLSLGKCSDSPPVTKPDPSQPVAAPDCVNVSLYILTDEYPEELSITLTNEISNEEVWYYNGNDLMPLTPYTSERCVDPAGCYNFTITDLFGDGLCYLDCYGEFEVVYGGTPVIAGDSFGSVATELFGGGC